MPYPLLLQAIHAIHEFLCRFFFLFPLGLRFGHSSLLHVTDVTTVTTYTVIECVLGVNTLYHYLEMLMSA